jgi:TonB family protein
LVGPVPIEGAPAPLGAEPPVPSGLVGREWLDAVHDKLHERWADSFLENARQYLPQNDPLNDASLAVTLTITVAPDGSLKEVVIAKSSGNQKFDAAAHDVVMDAAPFPQPPAELRSDDGLYHLTWVFARDARQDGVAGAKLEVREYEPSKAVPAMIAAGQWANATARLSRAASANPAPTGEAAETLVTLLRDLSLRVLEQALGDSDAATSADAVRALARSKDAGAGAKLRALAKSTNDRALERTIYEALGVLGDKDSVALLTDMVKTNDGARSVVAATSLAQLGERKAAWELVGSHLAASEKDAKARAAALATVAALGEPESAQTLALLAGDKGGGDRATRVAAVTALGAVAASGSDDAMRALIAALADRDAAVREAAATSIVRSGQSGKALYYKVLVLFKDRDPRVRAAGIIAAAAVDAKDAGGEILLLVKKDKDRDVQAGIATALGTVPGPDALAAVKALVDAKENAVRTAALQALAHRTEPDAKAVLAALSKDSDPKVRLLAVAATSDQDALAAMLTDDSLDVRGAALRALIVAQGALPSLPRVADLIGKAEGVHERATYAAAWLDATGR